MLHVTYAMQLWGLERSNIQSKPKRPIESNRCYSPRVESADLKFVHTNQQDGTASRLQLLTRENAPIIETDARPLGSKKLCCGDPTPRFSA